MVSILELDAPLRALLLSDPDVLLGDLVAHPSAPGVQEAPHRSGLVQTQLDEVVPAAQAPQLLAPLRRMGQVDAAGVGEHLEFADPLPRVVVTDGLVVVARRQRDRALEPVAQRAQVDAVEVGLRVPGTRGHHPATDIDSDRGRDDRLDGRDDRADRGPLAGVGVGQQRDMRVDDRQSREGHRLVDCRLVDRRRPQQHIRSESDGHGSIVPVPGRRVVALVRHRVRPWRHVHPSPFGS